MKKVKLLVSELEKVKTINIIKFIVTEFIILFLTIGSFYTNLTFTIQLIIFIGLSIVLIIFLVIYILKVKFVYNIRINYLHNPSLIVNSYYKRKQYHMDILDYLNEKLLFKEIVRTIENYGNYPDQGNIGPWIIMYDYQKTKRFYKENKVLNKTLNITSSFDNELTGLLNNLGVDCKKVYNLWGKKNYELMYPIYGMLMNDSQVLIHGLQFKEYKLNDVVIKPYERRLDNEDVIMLHIKVDR